MVIPPTFTLDVAKLDYLLRPRAKDDKSRYLALAGFTATNPAALEVAIRSAAASSVAVCDRVNEFGSFYVIRAVLTGPNAFGLDARLVFHLRNDATWAFVTLYPYRK